MVRINVSLAQKQVAELTRKLSPAQLALAQSRSLNRAIEQTKTATSREIRTVYAIPATGLSKRMPIKRSTRADLSAELRAESRPLPIQDFKPRQVRKGVSVAITKGNRKVITSAFIRTIGNKTGVFARGKYKPKGKLEEFDFRKRRIVSTGPDLPINELRSLSLAGATGHESVQRLINRTAPDIYVSRLAHEIKRLAEASITKI